MASICLVTPAKKVTYTVPRGKVSQEEVLNRSKIEIQYINSLSKTNGPVFKAIKREIFTKPNVDLWGAVWLFSPVGAPMWTGYMDLIHRGVSKTQDFQLSFKFQGIFY